MTSSSTGTNNAAEKPTWASWVLNVLFCGVIALPLVGTLWRKSDNDNEIAKLENRNATTLPAVPKTFAEWKQYPPLVEAFANDHFTFREQLLDQHHALKASLGISPSPMVAIGKDGWHFLRRPEEWHDVTGRHRLSTLEKVRCLAYLNKLHDRLKEQGIPFLIVLAPDKSSIYTEYLPISGVRGTRKERLNELLAFLEENHCRASILDLREPLRSRRQEGQLFLKHDTHWNCFGGAIGTQSIFQRLHELGVPVPHPWPPVSAKDFDWVPTVLRYDLSLTPGDMELLPSPKPQPGNDFQREENSARLRSVYPEMAEYSKFRITTHSDTGKGRLLMFRDSFGAALVDLMSRYFEHADYVWLCPSEEQLMHGVQELKPTVVVWELVERNLQVLGGSGPGYEEGTLVPQFLQEDIYTLTKKKLENLRVAAGHATLEPYKSGFAVNHQGGTPEIRLDRLPPLRKGLKAFQCIVKSPDACVFQLRDFSGLSLGEVPLLPGNNEVAMFLPYGDIKGPLIIRLGNARGEYTFRQLSILGGKVGATATAAASEVKPAAAGE
ncbi:hypothetical protein [Roseimicrobium sp. ORNL1]|uniref:alginate O-acetyltransferase AlgX-related protein n=1 Tax=Roseimicrobium sp. ORNL1 TaxID=2711231 RepID=UPI0013E177D5|nr:hypothetical protein [Roseimicrobium sp. ORNL1]QIF04271.1 hypothetical protein G5S37_23020 [Roseimicrobium sp. ORNL1]